MDPKEKNKIALAVLTASLIALISGHIANIIYHPAKKPEKRGFSVEVADSSGAAPAKVEEVVDITALMATASIEAGAKVFKKCASCHTEKPGGKHKVGPSLAGMVGSKIARHADFAYSGALAEKGGVWDYQNLYEFLKKPKAFAPGTKMSFAGLKKPKDIANVIAYIDDAGK